MDYSGNHRQEITQNSINYQDATFGNICCSIVSTPNISLLSGTINLNKSVRLKSKAQENSINFPFVMEGAIESDFYSFPKKQKLYPNSHNAIHLIDTDGEHLFPKGKTQIFHISLQSAYFFKSFISDDKVTDLIKNSINTEKPQVASSMPGVIIPEMKNIIKGIMDNPYEGGLKKMFLEIKTMELITLQLFQFGNQSDNAGKLSKKQQDLAVGVKEFLDQNFLISWTLDKLARKFGTNIQTLKISFKATFGFSIFSYYQQLRMLFAKQMLLDQNQHISEISEWLGYSHQNHFSAAFKKHFGYSPSELKP